MVSPAIAVQSRVRSCAFSVWKTTDRFVKCKKKTSTFFFMKGRMSTFLPRTYQKRTGGITACIAFSIFIVENPVEKVENPMENSPLSSQKRWKTQWKK